MCFASSVRLAIIPFCGMIVYVAINMTGFDPSSLFPQARNQGGAFAPPPTGSKGPHFDTQYSS